MVIFNRLCVLRAKFQLDVLSYGSFFMDGLRLRPSCHASFTNALDYLRSWNGNQQFERCFGVSAKILSSQIHSGGRTNGSIARIDADGDISLKLTCNTQKRSKTSSSRRQQKPPGSVLKVKPPDSEVQNADSLLEGPSLNVMNAETTGGCLPEVAVKNVPSSFLVASSHLNENKNSKPHRYHPRRKGGGKKSTDTISSSTDRNPLEDISVSENVKQSELPHVCKKKKAKSSSEKTGQNTNAGTKKEKKSKQGPVNFQKSKKPLKKSSFAIHSESAEKPSSSKQPLESKHVLAGNSNSRIQCLINKLYPATGKSVVVVESATKAKIIQQYLGSMYQVVPSYGHVRDLASRSGSVRPDEDFSLVWEVPSTAWTHLKSIKVALKGAENLILASDPDREGEAIAWHITEMLRQQDVLHENITVARVVFHEITESSVKNALMTPRHIDQDLVDAYLARRSLDYLIGFSISPLLWRKLPGCQSAGRVQSAALSLLCDREMEIEEFNPRDYWTVEADLEMKDGTGHHRIVRSSLTHFASKKLDQFSIAGPDELRDIEEKLRSADMKVVAYNAHTIRKNPPAPYITSTLQQDAANILHFPTAYAMKLAQKLYEGVELPNGDLTGLITYTRTDGLHVSDEAVRDIHSLIAERYGSNNLPRAARNYYKKVKNAQEAHEAIRPTRITLFPSKLEGVVGEDSLKLYSLIWCRTVACQMGPALINRIRLDVGTPDGSISLRSTCSSLEFPGYRSVYEDEECVVREREGKATDAAAFEGLRGLMVGDRVSVAKVVTGQHRTSPPARFSEASLVKKMEELGIGRPSTYAPTLMVLQDRKYVTASDRVLYPEFRGRMVSAFLAHHFSEVVDLGFTADMETGLDNVSNGSAQWRTLLSLFWTRFRSHIDRVSTVTVRQVEKMLEKTFDRYLFSSAGGSPPGQDGSRTCPSCLEGNMVFKMSKFGEGYFIGCDRHPACKYIAKTLCNEGGGSGEDEFHVQAVPKVLGSCPSSGNSVLLKNGPYGSYVQLGEDRRGYLPKRSSISHVKDVDSFTLEDALDLLRYPITLGQHPGDSKPVVLSHSKKGFVVRHKYAFTPLPEDLDPKSLDLSKALSMLDSAKTMYRGQRKRVST